MWLHAQRYLIISQLTILTATHTLWVYNSLFSLVTSWNIPSWPSTVLKNGLCPLAKELCKGGCPVGLRRVFWSKALTVETDNPEVDLELNPVNTLWPAPLHDSPVFTLALNCSNVCLTLQTYPWNERPCPSGHSVMSGGCLIERLQDCVQNYSVLCVWDSVHSEV